MAKEESEEIRQVHAEVRGLQRQIECVQNDLAWRRLADQMDRPQLVKLIEWLIAELKAFDKRMRGYSSS